MSKTKRISFKSVSLDDSNTRHEPKKIVYNRNELMNCIAYDMDDSDFEWSISSLEDNSLSSDTTSDITDVTPTSSLSNASVEMPKDIHKDNNRESETSSEPDKKTDSAIPDVTLASKEPGDVQPCPDEARGPSPSDSASGELQLIMDAISRLDLESVTSSQSSSQSRRSGSRKNLTFTATEVRRIERENAILVARLTTQQTRPRYPLPPPRTPGPMLASAAINRRKQQQRIDHDNMILLRKITAARATAGVRPKPERRSTHHDVRPSSVVRHRSLFTHSAAVP